MPRTGCAVPAPGVINGAPTSITARITNATPQDAAAQRRGDTCVARKTDATPQLAGNTAHTAANGLCRAGTGRHKWRPYVHHRPPADATPQDAATKRRGDTCVARTTVATPQLAGNIAYTAARNAADGSCRSGTGRHKWRPYVHHRAPADATPRTLPRTMPRTNRAVPAPGVINGAPTSITARQPPQRRRMPPPNVGATLVSPG